MNELWRTKEDWRWAAESIAVAIKGLSKSIVGADYSKEKQRLNELSQEGLDSLNDPELARRYQDQG